MFERKIYNKIREWKNESNGKTALLIEGARRIGKSTVVESFAKNEYKTYIFIDFSIASQATIELFNDMSDLNYFFLQLQLQYQVDLYERDSLIIFDEVQLCTKARQAIKVLVKDYRYDYIETGSLISIKKNTKDILIPSEERRIQMYPMDYEEFLWAINDKVTYNLLRQAFEKMKPLGEGTHRKLMRDFRLYMLIGGMPQAVSAYIETNNFKSVDMVKRDILNLYEDDFRKIDSSGKLSLLFEAIPAQLNKNTTRFQISSVLKNNRASDDSVMTYISELKDSKTVLLDYHVIDPNIGLSASKELEKYKLYLADTGLFVTMMFKDKDFTENVIYEKLLNDSLSVNLGYLYENIVAQTLVASGNDLFYYSFSDTTTRKKYEIDFLVSKKNKICPIEVKSSSYKKHSSLDAFSDKYSDRVLEKYLIYTKDISKDKDVKCIPVYLTSFITSN